MTCAFPGDKGGRESNLDQGTCSMCSGSSIKSFGSSNLQFSHKSWYFMSRNRCSDIQNGYKRYWNVPLTIWFDSGSSSNLKIIPILAGLMIALTSLFHANSNKTNNIQSDHQHLPGTKTSHPLPLGFTSDWQNTSFSHIVRIPFDNENHLYIVNSFEVFHLFHNVCSTKPTAFHHFSYCLHPNFGEQFFLSTDLI